MWGKGGALDFVLCGVVLGGALFRDCCIDCWEVLCVLRDLLVQILGGLRNGVKV